ncbi:efflux RND transporter permease subunit [Rhodothermus profundi]|uniref:Cobalt-zinc-cadmium resistance protein CzcA n=1 Tax=Rhodothermus profundi TaxID=633813 RepID=A0A1M6TPF9_9BACT|nr:CusA/CzcA family heavy metal efflux RND transporter [Rhodothermus profundi]SHK58803.1 cobalt-zinc-cadmium resistance protein CzcA [Rhodothermus profundi]
MRKLIDFALRNRLLVLSLGLLVMGAGWYAYTRLPVDAFPDVSPSLVQVFTVTRGLAPQEVEQYVTYPIERAMSGLPNLKQIRSVSNFGLSVVNIYFEDGTDIYFARQVVGERLQEVREQIPPGFGEPQMGPISTGMGLVLFYYLEDTTGRYSLEELRTIQDWVVKPMLESVPGVTEVLGIGGFERQFQVNVDPNALLRYGVTMTELVEAIEANNLNVGAQFIEQHGEQFVIRSEGLATGISDIENIVVKTVDGTPIYVRDLARVEIGGAIRRGLQTRNGEEEVVAGMVIKLYGTNASTVIARVEEKLAQIEDVLPPGIRIVPYYEQKTLVEAAVSTVTNALWQGILLVILVLVAFLGSWRPSVVVALSIPFSVLLATLFMGQLDISANLMSLGGLAIAIGMMVDGAIVMVENVDRHLRQAAPDEPRLHVVARACLEVARPVAFAIAIIVIVFLPLFTLQGVEGKTFRPLAYTTALAMFGSLVFALVVAPVLSSLFMRRSTTNRTPIGERIIQRLLQYYRPLVTFFVQHRRWALGLAGGLLLLGATAFPFLGSEFTPTLQEGTIVLRLTMAPSISLTEAKATTQRVERRLMQIPEVIGVVTRIGRGEVGAHSDPINSAEMYILLKDRDEWRVDNQEELLRLIREELGTLPGVLTNFTQPIQMTVDELLEGVRAELAVKLFGDDLETLKRKADEIVAVLQTIEGARDVQADQITGTPQIRIVVDRAAIARYGINVADVQRTIEAAIGGVEAGLVFEGVRRFPIYVRYQEPYRATPEQIRQLLIPAPGGIHVPLAELAQVEEVVGPRQITREDLQRFITIQLNVEGRDIGSFVAEAQRAIRERIELPPGYFITWGGQFELQQQANRRLMLVIPITLLIVLVLLYSTFNSVRNAALIILNIPLALVGGILALWLTGQHLSVPASVGFIALFGIALENGLVLVSYINQLIRDGLPIDRAAIQGALLRLRPVLMTALTTSLGLFPLLFSQGTGAEVQRPLATVVVGGLFTSTVLTLLVLPALYKWFAIRLPYDQPPTGS